MCNNREQDIETSESDSSGLLLTRNMSQCALINNLMWINISHLGGKGTIKISFTVRKMSKWCFQEQIREYWVLVHSSSEKWRASIRVGGQCMESDRLAGHHPSLQTLAILWRDNVLSFRQEIKARAACWCVHVFGPHPNGDRGLMFCI